MDSTKESLPKEESEAEKFGIETERVDKNFPPIIKGVQSALFCEYHQTVELEGKTIPVILEIKSAYYENISENLDVELSNIGRVGKNYCKLVDI